MSILLVLIPVALILLSIGVAAFFWAVNNRQFDDLVSPAYIVLLDDEPNLIKKEESQEEKSDLPD